MASQQIVLYDLASQAPGNAWSLNTWKVRLMLNYKKLDYRTVWLEYTEIKPTLKPHIKEEVEDYTVPTIALPSGEYIMDSKKIARYLEVEHPEPSLHMDSPYNQRILVPLIVLWDGLKGMIVSQVPKRLLNEVNMPYWRETREDWVGMTLEQADEELGGDKAWQKVAPQCKEMTALLEENEGPFFLGAEAGYADFQWAGFLLMMKRLGDDQWEGFKAAAGDYAAHERFLEALKPLTERDSH